ncbi:imidazolonepropionase [Pontibacter ummariensis]|uniref:Imidazolonepropionase n=1 Tax=Pontibacter ummariensis TaxID=1610492 RepID=A0A239C0E1_9BACT|nr:imidazolonepropionase [Pontibacter ummariensis]PRY15509.1 imidazolonepropionase [Pontibacter ummariensis]SNS13795.1 imidazolonepropionase [Pontibacter ummariensis]
MEATQNDYTLIGPFSQLLTMAALPEAGPIQDEELQVLEHAGVLVQGEEIVRVGDYGALLQLASEEGYDLEKIDQPMVLMPGLIDAHTHMCFAGSRAADYAMRVAGKSYLDIARKGGGILESVRKTREATLVELVDLLKKRCDRHLREGITTAEVKSGYGLSVDEELKMLEAIHLVHKHHVIDLVPTCLAAHMRPPEHADANAYLQHVLEELLPQVKEQGLANRVDIFIEDTAFKQEEALEYLLAAKEQGFELTVHADQFSTNGSKVAAEAGALSADHLEASGDEEIALLKEADVVATVLPGASLGLGMAYAPARKMLDGGLCLAIATDWNPGSAPMGDLLLQAALLGAAEKLTLAETLAAITVRAARALNLLDRGRIVQGQLADFIAFPTSDYREVLYLQGKMKPAVIWKKGKITVKSQKADRLY